jgi:ABC-type lipoprotein export system ATPase subunit
VIMVTHDPEAASVGDRLVVLRDGQIAEDAAPGSTEEVIELMKQLA